MANNLTNEGEIQVLSNLLSGVTYKSDDFGGSTAFTPTSGGLFVSLWLTDPTETGTAGTEVPTTVSSSASGYSRQSVVFGAGSLNTGTDPATQLTGPTSAITWTATQDWTTGAQTVGYFGLHLGSTGTMVIYGALTNSRQVTSGDQVKLDTNQLVVQLS